MKTRDEVAALRAAHGERLDRIEQHVAGIIAAGNWDRSRIEETEDRCDSRSKLLATLQASHDILAERINAISARTWVPRKGVDYYTNESEPIQITQYLESFRQHAPVEHENEHGSMAWMAHRLHERQARIEKLEAALRKIAEESEHWPWVVAAEALKP